MERCKVLPALSSRLSELESQSEELREKNRQTEQKLSTMQVLLAITSPTLTSVFAFIKQVLMNVRICV